MIPTIYLGKLNFFLKQEKNKSTFYIMKEINLNNNNNVIIKGRDKREMKSFVNENLVDQGISYA